MMLKSTLKKFTDLISKPKRILKIIIITFLVFLVGAILILIFSFIFSLFDKCTEAYKVSNLKYNYSVRGEKVIKHYNILHDNAGFIGGVYQGACELINIQISDADSNTFETISYEYSRDKDNVYVFFDDNIYTHSLANPKTFELLGSFDAYSKDKNYVYYHLHSLPKVIDGADPGSFELINKTRYAKDKNNVYYEENIILGADPLSYELLDDGYAKDKNNVFYHEKIIEGADASSFKIDGRVKDKNCFYSSGEQRNCGGRYREILCEGNKFKVQGEYVDLEGYKYYKSEKLGVGFTYMSSLMYGDFIEIDNKIIDCIGLTYITVHNKSEDETIEEAILNIVEQEGKNKNDCQVVEFNDDINLKNSYYRIELSGPIEYSEEQLKEIEKIDINSVGAYKHYIYAKKLIDLCSGFANPAGSGFVTSLESYFLYNDLKNKTKFIYLPATYDPVFYDGWDAIEFLGD